MPKFLFLAIIFWVLAACNSSTKKEESPEYKERTDLARHASLELFADSLVRLNKYDEATLEMVGYYFQKLVPADTTLADSAAVLFLHHAWSVVDTVNQELWKDTTNYMDLVYEGGHPPTESQRAFQLQLQRHHINLQGNGEGDVLAVFDYDWFNGIVQPKTSGAVDSYLALLAKEEKEPALQDAGLTIELPDLINRLIVTEELAPDDLPTKFAEDLARKNKFYTDILLLGSDNTPALEDEQSMKPAADFKKAYDYLLATYPTSKAAQRVKEWLKTLRAKDKKKVEELRLARYQ